MKITLKAARINAGLDQTDVSREIGVNPSTVSSWENGKTKPSLDNFRKLCALYECKEEEIKL